MAFTALYDACVLYPAPLRDLLMHLARTDLYRARWSAEIHAEWIAAVLRNRPELAARLNRTRDLMDSGVDDCLVTGHSDLVDRLALPDPKDRHVLAAAIVGRADVIVTSNTRHFPEAALRTYGIEAQHPDVFIRHVLDLHETAALMAVQRLRMGLSRPAMQVEQYLDTLARQGLPEVVAFLRQRSTLI